MTAAQRKGRPLQQTGNRPKISGQRSGDNYSTLAAAITAARRVEGQW